ncbi:hypothetical protein NQ317_015200 [Molorchus minor]|uniref:Endonuclease/exonuclease/phosphatase domain-containing protein n=1 Tax=Molorchus minor TaxID=1323400 RepID=A0ABQ9JNX5_9CUCU|nr:hypothetical protein NQ317_015200 [Molorchus minor]
MTGRSKKEESVEDLIHRVCTSFATKIEARIEKQLNKLDEKLIDLTNSLKSLNSNVAENKKSIESLDIRVDNLSQYNKKNTLRLIGCSESHGDKDVVAVVLDIINNKLNVSCTKNEIDSAFRIRSPGNVGETKPRTISIKFVSNIKYNEDLTKPRYDLLQAAKKKYSNNKAWSAGGKIYVWDDQRNKKRYVPSINELSIHTGFDVVSDYIVDESLDIIGLSETWLNSGFPDYAYKFLDIKLFVKIVLEGEVVLLFLLKIVLMLKLLMLHHPEKTQKTTVPILGPASTVDLIITSNKEFITDTHVIDMGNVSDHCLVTCSVKVSKEKRPQIFHTYRDFSNFNYDMFLMDLRSINWNLIYSLQDVNEIIEFWNNNVTSLYDVHAPCKSVRISKAPAPWLTDNLKLMIKLKRRH